MKKRRFFCALFLIFSFISISCFAAPHQIPKSKQQTRTPISVFVIVSNNDWVETIAICNISGQPVPLNDIEFDFTYSLPMPNYIWGQPNANWKATQTGNSVVLLGSSPFIMPADSTCENPITIQFNIPPGSAAPTGPFIFKAAIPTPPPPPPPGLGAINVIMPPMPAIGLPNPVVTIQGAGSTSSQPLAWGSSWLMNNLAAGSYTVTSSNVDNGSAYFTASPVSVTVSANQISNAVITYTQTGNNTNLINSAWVYDSTYSSTGQKTGTQPGLFASAINAYNNQAQPGHKLTALFSYGGDLEMYCNGSGGSSSTTPCTASTMLAYYTPQSTTAYYTAAQSTANPLKMYPIVDGVIGGPYLTTFNSLSQAEAEIFADSVAQLYCADDNVHGVQFDLEPFDITQPGQAYFFAQIAKDFAGQHNGPGQSDPYHCIDTAHPKGRTFSVFTFAAHVNATVGSIFTKYGNGWVIDSLYDLGPNPGGVVNSVTNYTTYVKAEIAKMMANAKAYNVPYQLSIPAAASVHEFESVNGQSTGYQQISYVQAAISAINASGARSDPLFRGIDLWAWDQQMWWSGKQFTPASPSSAVLQYLGTTL